MDPYHVHVNFIRVYPMDIIIPTTPDYFPIDPPSGDQYFNIRVNEANWQWRVSGARTHVIEYSDHVYEFFNISKKSIEPMIRTIVGDLNVPTDAHNSLATAILDAAEDMANVINKEHKILYIGLDINVDTYYDDNSDDGQNIGAFTVLHPASKSAIEGLKRVEINEQEELSGCSMCLEDFRFDMEAVRMPCLHVFHKSCIFNWLRLINNCPLCRFEIPHSDN